MNLDLGGRTAIVTGSTAGIGLAIARQLARQGAKVIVNGRSETRVAEAVGAIGKDVPGAVLEGIVGDLGTADGIAAFTARVRDADVLINNLGIFDAVPFADITDADWLRFFEVNVMSGIRLSRHYLPGMMTRNWGRIVFISSESGLNIPEEMIHYGMTKTAQLAVSRGLAKLTRGTAVTVNSVLPGPTLSEGVEDFVRKLFDDQESDLDTLGVELVKQGRPTSLIQRLASVDEVANMVGYVASPAASATNGAALRVDGGVVDFIA